MKDWKAWVGIIISALAVWWALQGIAFDKVGGAIANLDWFWIIVAQIPYFIVLIMKVTRWQLLFAPGPMVKLKRLWETLMMSYFFNTVLPARLGEVVRAYALGRSENIGMVRVLSTILLEKILDLMTIFIFLIALLPFLNIPTDVRNIGLLVGGLFVVAFILSIIMAIYRKQAERFILFCLKPLPESWRSKLFGFACEVLDVLGVLLDWKLSLNVWAQSIAMWVIVLVNYMFIAFAFGMPLTLELAVLLTIITNLGMAVPSAPGYIGVFESTVIIALINFFPDKDALFSFGLILHITSFLPVIILGAIYTSKEGIDLSKMQNAKKDTDTPETTSEPLPTSASSQKSS